MGSQSTGTPLFDKRLIGTWESDRRRTFRQWKPKPGTSPAAVRKLKSLFGKMTIQYTRQYATVETRFDFFPGLEPTRERDRYEVVALDRNSVVIRVPVTGGEVMKAIFGESQLYQIHFDGDSGYYISIDPALHEYFRRIK